MLDHAIISTLHIDLGTNVSDIVDNRLVIREQWIHYYTQIKGDQTDVSSVILSAFFVKCRKRPVIWVQSCK